jgi:HEPN domain-containing protein
MNRDYLKKIALIRRKEAQVLLKNRNYDGAYYLSGYIVECGLKACIAKRTERYDFPDKKRVNESYTHELEKLVKVAGLMPTLEQEIKNDSIFDVYWSVVKDWSEDSRYQDHTRNKAYDIYSAITNRKHGVLRWIKQHW